MWRLKDVLLHSKFLLRCGRLAVLSWHIPGGKCENIVYIAEFSADFFVGKSLAAGIRKVGFKIMDNFIGQCGIKRFQAFF